ncbi:hypothetical protein [Marinicella gelatinilytica]|uniref:hypothetical protein n=1 Tax=Marinicella gelatinilytica TaxID=2996017 RepID=UPI002260F026|nr:hypothetical protein [Marinicella gelatinilytica]MCX7546031.1 hypothetical protein [Marinicella gelatinilytica]
MKPVTIKSHNIIDGLWFSQFILAVIFISAWFLVPLPWSLLTLALILAIRINHRQILNNQTHSLMVNAQRQWFKVVADRLMQCRLNGYWHISQFLWLRLTSEQGVQYCLIIKSHVGGSRYAQLLMAITQDEQQAE